LSIRRAFELENIYIDKRYPKREVKYSCGCLIERYGFTPINPPETCTKHPEGKRVGEEIITEEF
jgi:hypothetical protein